MKTYSRVYAKIDLDAIAYNMEQMKQNIRPETKVMAVIKADGYGHGAVQIAEMMERWNYIWGFAVATLDEAVVLRTEGIQKPILVLGCVFPDQYMEMLKHEIRMNIYTEEMAESISRMAAREGKTAYMHIKLDTGMSRLGFGINEQSAETIKRISKMPNVNMEGIFTHFTKADEKDKSFTKKQILRNLFRCERSIVEERPLLRCGRVIRLKFFRRIRHRRLSRCREYHRRHKSLRMSADRFSLSIIILIHKNSLFSLHFQPCKADIRNTFLLSSELCSNLYFILPDILVFFMNYFF